MALREILAVFGVKFDGKALEQGNKKIEEGVGLLKGFGAVLGTAFALDRVKEFTLGMIEQADAIGDQAAILNTSTDALQQWQFAAGFVELSGEALTGIFTRLSVSADKADESSKGVGDTLKKLGVDVKGQNGELKAAPQLFEEVGLALAGMSDKTEATAKAVQLFGRANAAKVLAIFKDGKPGLEAFRKEFERLGGAFDSEFVAQAGAVDDEMKKLNVAWTSAKVKITGLALPAINALTHALTAGSIALQNLLRNTNVGGVIATAAGITALGLALQKGLPLLKHWKLAVAALAAEDLYSFLKGDDSLIGDTLDAVFGQGTQDKVRDWIKDVGNEVKGFVGNAGEDMRLFWKTLKTDAVDSAGPILAPVVSMWLGQLGFFWDLATGGWQNFSVKTQAIMSAFGAFVSLVWSEMKGPALIAIASIEDAFGAMVNALTQHAGRLGKLFGLDPSAPLSTDNADRARGSLRAEQAGARTAIGSAKDIVNGSAADINRGYNAVPNVAVTAPQTFIFNGDMVASEWTAAVGSAAGKGQGNVIRKAGAALRQRGSQQ